MAKFRMVPDNLQEAEFISKLIVDANTRDMGELTKGTDRTELRKRVNWEANWQGIVADLKEEGADEETPTKPAPIKPTKEVKTETKTATAPPAK